MSNTASKLKPIDMGLTDEFLVHLIFVCLPKEYETFVNYNLQPEKWNIEKLIAMCVQEEERLKSSHGDSINHVKENKKNFNNKKAKSQGKPQWDNSFSSKSQGKAPQNDHHQKSNLVEVDKDTYRWCKKTGHYQKDCPEFLKHLIRKGEDIITFVDESLYLSYAKSIWWIDSGATIHVANSL
jgi:RNA polymerase-binding transcription factor DksA